MSDIINIDQFETIENIEISVFPTYNEINVNRITGGGGSGAVSSVNGQIGDVVLTKTDLNLGNVDNTSDVNKPISSATQTALDLKVDKITGKGLSTNDYTTIEKIKLSGIQDGAEVNVNADWNATTGDALILNKPTIPSALTFVPYTGATSDLDLGTNNLIADHIALNVSPSGAGFVVGSTQWNNTLGSSETLLKGGNVILKNGVDLLARVINKVVPNTTLTKASYQVVKVSGAIGQKLAVDLAQANTDLNSADTLGIVIETIATNQEGFIMTVGQIEEINTTGSLQGETWLDGDVLYLSPTIAGRVTNIKPTGATGHIVILGYVEHSHATQGKIYVKIMNGWELDELHNVFIDTPLNNQALIYETSTDLWKNKTIIEDIITDGVTNKAPSQNAVFDALALKQNALSYTPYRFIQTSQTAHTGTVAETIIGTATINAGTFNSSDVMKVLFKTTKPVSASSCNMRIRINTTNTLTGATQIAFLTIVGSIGYALMTRTFDLQGGNLYGYNFASSLASDVVATNTVGTTTAYNTANTLYLFFTIQLGNIADSATSNLCNITN